MAIDSRNKRFSLLGFGQPHQIPCVLPNPDGSLANVFDRAMLIYLYAGLDITTGSPMWLRMGGVPHWRPGPRQLGGRGW